MRGPEFEDAVAGGEEFRRRRDEVVGEIRERRSQVLEGSVSDVADGGVGVVEEMGEVWSDPILS